MLGFLVAAKQKAMHNLQKPSILKLANIYLNRAPGLANVSFYGILHGKGREVRDGGLLRRNFETASMPLAFERITTNDQGHSQIKLMYIRQYRVVMEWLPNVSAKSVFLKYAGAPYYLGGF